MATKQKRAKPSGHRTSSGGEEDILRTSALESEILKKTEHLVMEEKGKLSQIQFDKIMKPKPTPPRPQFKKRLVSGDEEILQRVMERGPDKEDVQMFRLALGRMKSDGDEMVMGVSWAYYPHNILLCENLPSSQALAVASIPGRPYLQFQFLAKHKGKAWYMCVVKGKPTRKLP